MKKTKLFGTRIIENIQVPRTPKIIILDYYDRIENIDFEEGDLIDAQSVKRIMLNFGSDNTSAIENATVLPFHNKIENSLPTDSIEILDEQYSIKHYAGVVFHTDGKFYAYTRTDDGIVKLYNTWSAYKKYGASTDYLLNDDIIYYDTQSAEIVKYDEANNKLVALTTLELHVGPDTPSDKTKLWVDTGNGISLTDNSADEIKLIKKSLSEMYLNMEIVKKMILHGVIAGNASSSAREVIMSLADSLKPQEIEEDKEVTPIEPSTEGLEPTVNHISIKMDTALNFVRNRLNLIDGEILYYTDRKKLVLYKEGKFIVIGTTEQTSEGTGGISVEDLYSTLLEYLHFTDGTNQYKIQVDSNGKFNIRKVSSDITTVGAIDSSWQVYVNHLLCINEVFCGGDLSENAQCSHNFVELANGSNKDINLNGIFLLYTDGEKYSADSVGYKWKVLQLDGIIKAGSTYLIRGAKCNKYNTLFISVDTYDQEWLDGGKPIVFSQSKSSFYLCVGDKLNNWVYDDNGQLMGAGDLVSPWDATKIKHGYIDSCGFGSGSVGEGGTTFLLLPEDSWNESLFVRWFMLEPAKQGNKAGGSRKTTNLWTYINLNKQTQYLGNSTQYYYPDYIKQTYTPKASWEGKNFFTNKNVFSPICPNVIRCTFGIQATFDDIRNIKASRCFNWVSVGNFDEFVEYRKKGDLKWNREYSITDDNSSNPSWITKFISHYKRMRWKTASGTYVTTHKVILKNKFEDGVYEYRIGRHHDINYYSDIREFTVYKNSQVTTFKYIQETDQQGFNWQEYLVWKRTAECINKSESDYHFLINTGDITQSGNRESEWLDYYDGLDTWLSGKEEMFTIGNNDLCGNIPSVLTDGEDVTSKYNHINVLRYFTFELDELFDYSFEWMGNRYPLYSLYSFNFGNFHFICLNSETTQASSKVYQSDWETTNGDRSFADSANAYIEMWLEQDLKKFTGKQDPTDCKNVIVYMHEMPFTMVTWQFMSGKSAREGSGLNKFNSNGQYRFSRLFKKYGIRLVMGGHKHTFTVSKPIYDAPEGYINDAHKPVGNLMDNVTTQASRTPVIQVTKAEHIDQNMSKFARYELVDKIDAPTYVMSQSSGYKLISNKEQPSGDQYQIPWLLSYFKAATNGTSPKENVKLHYPMYIVYELSDTSIVVTAKQVHGIWDVDELKNKSSIDINKLLTNLSSVQMTLNPINDQDAMVYNIVDKSKFTITL